MITGDQEDNEKENENEDEEEDENKNEDEEESDIMLDDLDDETMQELDAVIAKIMKKERKPKMKPPTGSSKGLISSTSILAGYPVQGHLFGPINVLGSRSVPWISLPISITISVRFLIRNLIPFNIDPDIEFRERAASLLFAYPAPVSSSSFNYNR
jgi:hypothetical protein